MRFAVRSTFNGNNYFGWQSQEKGNTVQNEIETVLSRRYGREFRINGCCRTDSGVHANDFVFHFDYEKDIRDGFIVNLNKMLPSDIAFKSIAQVSEDFHSRFDAISRSYVYRIHTIKNPFLEGLSFYFPPLIHADRIVILHACELLKSFSEFYPFCKSNTDVKTMICNVSQIELLLDQSSGNFTFSIVSDRFLRGMVRLIVGAFINAGLGKISLNDLELAMKMQTRLEKSLSVPAHGLYLNEIKYLTLD